MERPAPAQHPIHELLAKRWSARAMDPDKPVARETVLSILEAARWAPSSSNEQPWRFLVFDEANADAREKARSILTGSNKIWATRAPVLVLTVAKEAWTKNGEPNRHAQHDVGLCTENLLLQVIAHGLAVHPMAGYELDKAREMFAIPAGYTPMAMIAIAHFAPVDTLPDFLQEREKKPRERKPLAELAFAGAWEKPFV